MTAQPPDPSEANQPAGEQPAAGEPPAIEPPIGEPPSAVAPEWGGSTQPAPAQPPPMTPTPPPPTAPPPVEWGAPPSAPSSQPGVPGAPGMFFAATVTRVAALLIDSIVFGVIAAIVGGLIGGVVGGAASFDEPGSAASMGLTITAGLAGVVVSFLYFTLLWRSTGKATIGQRVFRMQVGNAFDGATLTWRQASIRWLTLFGLGIVAALPVVGGLGGLVAFIWSIVLLVSVTSSPTKQGFQDRWANSAVVATGPQNTGLAWGCLIAYIVAIVLVFFVALAAILALAAVYFGTQ